MKELTSFFVYKDIKSFMKVQMRTGKIIQNNVCFNKVKTMIIGLAMEINERFINLFISHITTVVINPTF